jgi:hypothetical protein
MGITIGFGFVPFPPEIWDDNIQLTLPEFRLFGYLLRWGELGEDLPFLSGDEMLHGRLNPDGVRLDAGCGLPNLRSVEIACKALLARGWIAVAAIDGENRYRVSLEE